jgi:hypothetical protein
MKLSLFIFLLLWLILQIFTLDKVPLPWFDEVFFESLAENLAKKGTFHVPIAVFGEEVKIYGFVYFFLVIISKSIFCNPIFAFRFVNFLFGIGGAYLFFLHSKKYTKNTQESFLITCIFLLDPFFNLCLHEGRMDLTAFFFLYFAFLIIERKENKNFYIQYFLIGFLSLIALLTTPRIAFAGLGMGVFLCFKSFENQQLTFRKKIKLLFLSLFVIVLGYIFWIIIAFQNFSNFLQYFSKLNSIVHQDASLFGWFVGGTGYIPKHQYFLLLLLLLSFLFSIILYFQKSKNLKNTFFDISEISIIIIVISFHILVKDYGQYSIFVLFFYYVLLIKFMYQIKDYRYRYIHKILIFSISFFNFSYFLVKNMQVFLTLEQRNLETATQFIQKNIPKNSRVVGEALYAYSVKKSGSFYQLFEVYKTLEEREKIQREIYKFDFLIVTYHSQWRHKKTIDYYLKKNTSLKPIAYLDLPISKQAEQFIRFFKLSPNENTGYSAIIYKRL